MFVRRARIRTTDRGEYFTYRLVRSERSGDRVRQHTCSISATIFWSGAGIGRCCAPGFGSCSTAKAS